MTNNLVFSKTQLLDGVEMQKIASAMNEPLRTAVDYMSITRDLLAKEGPVDNGFVFFDTDTPVDAMVVGNDGRSIESHVQTTRVTIPLVTIAANPVIDLRQLPVIKYDILKRMVDKARSIINQKEDSITLSLFEKTVQANSSKYSDIVINGAGNDLDQHPELVSQAAGVVTNYTNAPAAAVILNPKQLSKVRLFGRDIFSFTTQEELIQKGYVGSLWGMKVYQTPICPEDKVFVVGRRDLVGRFYEGQPLQSIPTPDPGQFKTGFNIYELVGWLVYNPGGVVMITGLNV